MSKKAWEWSIHPKAPNTIGYLDTGVLIFFGSFSECSLLRFGIHSGMGKSHFYFFFLECLRYVFIGLGNVGQPDVISLKASLQLLTVGFTEVSIMVLSCPISS